VCERQSLLIDQKGPTEMSLEKAEAFVIRQADWSESSRVITLFSREFGKFSAIAKGVKRLRSPFEAALDLLTRCQIVFLHKASDSLDILTEAQLVQRFQPGTTQLERLYAGYYFAELLDGLTEPMDPHPELYDATVAALDQLIRSPVELVVLRWELTLMEEIGQLPELTACVLCGQAVQPEMWFDFSVGQGGLICATCHPDAELSRRVQPGTLAILQQIREGGETLWSRLALSASQHSELRRIMLPTILHTLGRRPRTLDFLKFLRPRSN